MAHTNSTPNYNLPQFLGTDKPAWLTDVNNAMSDIDTAIAAAKTTADSADTAVSGLAVTVGNHTSQLSTLSGAVTSQGNTLNTVTALIGNGVPTTTDQTIIGAINELAAIVEAGEVSVTADGVKTMSQILDALYALIDASKVTVRSKLVRVVGTNNERYFHVAVKTPTEISFVKTTCGLTLTDVEQVTLKSSGSTDVSVDCNVGGSNTASDGSSVVATSGNVFKVIY